MAINLKVNGKVHRVDATPGMPLLWVLRDVLGLKGTKFGCGGGYCGACTVHLDGQAVRACSVPVEAIGNADVRTIEAGPDDASLARVQAAWVEAQVPQCGYCQPGMIMSVASLLAAEPNLKPAQVRERLTNICRCGTYDRINSAIDQLFAGAR